MDNTLPDGFGLVELTSTPTNQDIRDLIHLIWDTNKEFPDHYMRVVGYNAEQIEKWVEHDYLRKQLEAPRNKCWAIRDRDTGHLIAYTVLQYPGPEPQSAPPGLPVGDSKTSQDFSAWYRDQVYPITQGSGWYDAERDFHKRNTFVLREYQGGGLGKFLTGYTNAIADRAGKSIFVFARRRMWKLLESTGFKEKVGVTIDYSKWSQNVTTEYRYYERKPKTPGQTA